MFPRSPDVLAAVNDFRIFYAALWFANIFYFRFCVWWMFLVTRPKEDEGDAILLSFPLKICDKILINLYAERTYTYSSSYARLNFVLRVWSFTILFLNRNISLNDSTSSSSTLNHSLPPWHDSTIPGTKPSIHLKYLTHNWSYALFQAPSLCRSDVF